MPPLHNAVPWWRRASVNTGLAIAGIFFPPCLWIVCVNCLTGKIYENRWDAQGNRRTWHPYRKAIAIMLALWQGAALLLLLLD